ncbi:gcn5-related n-acetyltransferase [Niveomyces insectorum RCEF 264]|uniref:Gcn5-related n-acetyltransferase n=1 Tax=Niveomyces insectorum RCEF 264 TaxID=1081102 RepID=A0A167SRY6_9HYPO|nr:gcn5-related n-acetyltransferase [Niveomyces insectorum RCEF 264]
MATPTATAPLSWRRDVPVPVNDAATDGTVHPRYEHFLCSSDPALIQLDALGAAMASDLLWWASPLEPETLAALVANSVCLGVYHLQNAEDERGAMVGFARLATDRVTFAYLTDVYVLPAYQRRGLGAWLMECLRALVAGGSVPGDADGATASKPGWPHLRSLWLIASTPAAARMYTRTLGTEAVARYRSTPGEPNSGMILLEMVGPSSGMRTLMKKEKKQRETAAEKGDGSVV